MSENNQGDPLVSEVLDLVIKSVHLQHMDRSKIRTDLPLTKDGLGLDSIDILEIVVAVEHKFGVKIANAEDGKKHFRSIETIAELVRSRR